MTASTLPYGASVVTTHGPFPDKAACETFAKWASTTTSNPKTHPVFTTSCWSDR